MRIEEENWIFDSSIWPHPIFKDASIKLGLHGQKISSACIPYNIADLEIGDKIENKYGDILIYNGSGEYTFLNEEVGRFLSNYMCEWTKMSRNIEFDREKIYIHKGDSGYYKLHELKCNEFVFIDLNTSDHLASVTDTAESVLREDGGSLYVFDSFKEFIEWAYTDLKK